jgi:hypothetical protein
MRYPTYTIETHTRSGVRFVCLTDRNEGMSITNGAETIVRGLLAASLLVAGDRLIYCDTMGVWDEILFDSRCGFLEFRSVNARDCESAMTYALEHADHPHPVKLLESRVREAMRRHTEDD